MREQTRLTGEPKHGGDQLLATVGLDAQVKQSGRWTGQARMRKCGNRHVRRPIMLAAQTAARTDPQRSAIYEAQRAKGKHHTVTVSYVAHQLLHIAYSVLLHGKSYELPARFDRGGTEGPPCALGYIYPPLRAGGGAALGALAGALLPAERWQRVIPSRGQ